MLAVRLGRREHGGMNIFRPLLIVLLILLALPAAANASYRTDRQDAIVLSVDARDIQRNIQRVHLQIPVQAGPMTLLYPRWIPGHHAPTGPINQIAGLRLHSNSQPLRWRRDPLDVYAFHVEIPAGSHWLDVRFEYFSPTARDQGRIASTPDMLAIQWHRVLMYPAGTPVANIAVKPHLLLPAEWASASALKRQHDHPDGRIEYARTSLETVVDSPVYAGRYLRRIVLDSGAQPVSLNVMADTADDLDIAAHVLTAHRALVSEADWVFGPRPFERYDFLLAVSAQFSAIGLEHASSSENGLHAGYLRGEPPFIDNDLLAHEYVHVWNGKWKRPAPSWTPDYHAPMQNDLLWMYEGQTQYWAWLLAARSGLYTREQALAVLAKNAAESETRHGRQWRDLLDTGHQGIIDFNDAPQAYEDWQRGYDFYSEGALLWLAVDTRLAELSAGRYTLDDFARAFFAGKAGQRIPAIHDEAEIITALHALAPDEDWAIFLQQRLHGNDHAPLDGLARSGWQLVWRDAPNIAIDDAERSGAMRDFSYSLGMLIGDDGDIRQVRWESPAWGAGLARDMQLIAVNGRRYSGTRMEQAMREAMQNHQPITLLIRQLDTYRTVSINYFDGPRQPHLQRIPHTPDRLSGMLAPRRR